MKKLVIWFHFKENFTICDGILLHFKSLLKHKTFFRSKGYEIIDGRNFIKSNDVKRKIMDIETNYNFEDHALTLLLKDAFKHFIETVKNSEEYNNSIILCFYPITFDLMFINRNYNILKSKRCKCIIWHDDFHGFLRAYQKRNNIPPQDKHQLLGFFEDHRLDNADYIISPGRVYLKNVNSKYLEKTYFVPWVFNEDYFDLLNIRPFQERKRKILLSGYIGSESNTRVLLKELFENANSNLHKIIDYLPKNSKCVGKNTSMRGINYYKKISTYRAAIVGMYERPINYVVSKIIEIISCGTLLITNENPELQTYGLKKFIHYVPILINDNNEVVDDDKYYLEYLDTEKGKNIAHTALEHIKNNFKTIHYCERLINIIETNEYPSKFTR